MNRLAAVLATGLMVITSCSVAPETTPRDIDTEILSASADDPAGDALAASGTGHIFLLAPSVPGSPAVLSAVARDVNDDVGAVTQALLGGPNPTEFLDQYRSALPADLSLNSFTRRQRGLVLLDVSKQIEQLNTSSLILALAQIVYSVSNVAGVDSVLISVDGEVTQWPAGNGELQSDPLTVYDFPGLEPSSQPAFPSVPS